MSPLLEYLSSHPKLNALIAALGALGMIGSSFFMGYIVCDRLAKRKDFARRKLMDAPSGNSTPIPANDRW